MTTKSDAKTAVLHTRSEDLSRFSPAENFTFIEFLCITPPNIVGRSFIGVTITSACERELRRLKPAAYDLVRLALNGTVAKTGGSITVEEPT